MLTLAVGIPTLGREEVLLETLECVLKQADAADEVIVADQNSQHQPQTSARLHELAAAGHITVLHLPNPSLTAARNAILRASCCDYVLFIDDDVYLGPEFVGSYRKALNDARAHVLAGAIDENGSGSSVECHALFNDEDVVDLVRGANIAVERNTALGLGGFDERFVGPAHGEEQDFAFRLLRCGKSVSYDGRLRLNHRRAPTGGCRVAGNVFWSDWQKPMNWLMFGFRYPAITKKWWWRRIWAALRCGPLLRENFHLTRQPAAWGALAYAVVQAWLRKNEIRSSIQRSPSA